MKHFFVDEKQTTYSTYPHPSKNITNVLSHSTHSKLESIRLHDKKAYKYFDANHDHVIIM